MKMKKRIVDIYDLALMPIFIVILAILLTTFFTYLIGSRMLKEKTKEMGLNTAREIALAIENNKRHLNKIDEIIEDKIITVGKSIVLSGKSINNQLLKEFAYRMGVFEINLFNSNGKIISSNLDEYVGQSITKEHPAYYFISKRLSEWVEDDIRKDVASNRYLRYGYVRLNDDYFIQVGILANDIHELKRIFSPKNLLNNYANDKNMIFISVFDKKQKLIASIGDMEDNQFDLHPYLKSIYDGKTVTIERIDKKNINKIIIMMPIISEGKYDGLLILGLTLKDLILALYRYFIVTLFIAIISSIFILLMAFYKFVKPLDKLSRQIEEIDLDDNLNYRIAVDRKDDFAGLKDVVNNLLDRINLYLNKYKEHEEELAASNEELIATVEQLTAVEEELKAQYDEIQTYNERLKELQEKYEIAIEGSNSAVWELDLQERKLEVSKNFLDALDFKLNSSNDLDYILDNFIDSEDKSKILDAYYNYINGNTDRIFLQIKIKDIKGNFRWFLVSARCLNQLKTRKLYGILTEITQLKEQEERIKFLAYNDHLTGLPNRRMLDEVFSSTVSLEKAGAVVLLDIDNFKNINDTKGHVYGDLILKKVAEIFYRLKNEDIMFFRFGGDEFIVLIQNKKEIMDIDEMIGKVIKNLTEEVNAHIKDVNITVSAGIALYPSHGVKTDELLMKADAALYRAKYSGKNKYVFFDERMIEELKERVIIENTLRGALNTNGFRLLYQPIVDTKTKEIVSFEALLRLRESNISPAKFIPIAEEAGLIIPIGEWVIKNTVKQLKYWIEKGLRVKPVAINISPIQLKDINFIYKVKNFIEEFDMDPSYIEFEITENIMLENHDEVIRLLNELKGIGIKISLDDFGTGYSSINYLTFLPVDKVKLDKNLSDRFLNHDDKNIIKNLISLVKSLNLKVVAEGIESDMQMELLEEVGCEYVQGYVISRPLPEEEIEAKCLR